MTITRTIIAVALTAVLLVAVPASAQTSSTESDRTAALQELADNRGELIEHQQTLIENQRVLIDNQERLLNAYRCRFKVDVEAVPGGCTGKQLTEAETADSALVCAGWLAEREETSRRLSVWTTIALGFESGAITMDSPTFTQATPNLAGYKARLTAVIPSLQTERLAALFTAMADSLQTMSDTHSQGGTETEMAAAIRAAIDRLNELHAALAQLCS